MHLYTRWTLRSIGKSLRYTYTRFINYNTFTLDYTHCTSMRAYYYYSERTTTTDPSKNEKKCIGASHASTRAQTHTCTRKRTREEYDVYSHGHSSIPSWRHVAYTYTRIHSKYVLCNVVLKKKCACARPTGRRFQCNRVCPRGTRTLIVVIVIIIVAVDRG